MIKVGKMNQSIFFNINQILKGRLVLDKILRKLGFAIYQAGVPLK